MNKSKCIASIITTGISVLAMQTAGFAGPALQEGVWTEIFPSGAARMAIDPSNPSILYLGTTSNGPAAGIHKSTDGGSTWTRIGKIDGVTDFSNDVCTFVDPNNPQRLYGYCGVNGINGFWISTDAGTTWKTPQGWRDVQTAVGITSCSGMNDVYSLATDPTDFNHLIVSFHSPWSWCGGGNSPLYGTDGGMLESTDGGTSWIPHDPMSGFGYGNGSGFLFNPSKGIGNKNTWLFGSQGSGYWRTTDAGASWTKLNTPNQTHGGCQIYAASSGAFYVTSASAILRSTNVGASWQALGSSNGLPSNYYLGITGDGNNLYTGCEGGGLIYMSPESDGLTWVKVSDYRFTNGPRKLYCDRVNGIVYAPCNPDGLWAYKIPSWTKAIAQQPAKFLSGSIKVIDRTGNRVMISGQKRSSSGKSASYDINGRLIGNTTIVKGAAGVSR